MKYLYTLSLFSLASCAPGSMSPEQSQAAMQMLTNMNQINSQATTFQQPAPYQMPAAVQFPQPTYITPLQLPPRPTPPQPTLIIGL